MFKSFYMAGFESATGYNAQREWIDQISATQHDLLLDDDYARIREQGLRVAREAVRWPLVDQGGSYDFSTLDAVLEVADKHGIDLILDLFHYGYPPELDPFSDTFVERFSQYCEAVADHVQRNATVDIFYTPVNEPSYFAWAAGEAGLFAPHQAGRAYELKVNLAKACIRGIDAIRRKDRKARIVHADPICRVCCPEDRCDLEDEVRHFNEVAVFESFDIISGRKLPELGGSPDHLDIVGINYYWTNQWEHTKVGVPLCDSDDRCWALRDLVRWVWHRYRHPIVITETAHVHDNRGPYIDQLAEEVQAIHEEGIPLLGVCLYPVLGMPEWHDRTQWTRLGLWDLHRENGELVRVPHEPSLEALQRAQERVGQRRALRKEWAKLL